MAGKITDSNGGVTGMIWDGKQWTELGAIPGAKDINLLDMNSTDQVIGYYLDAQWMEHYFLWQKGEYQNLDFTATDINNNGTILGFSSDHLEGLLWSKQTTTYFSGIEGNSISPNFITNNGLITGQCFVPSGYTHACLWTN